MKNDDLIALLKDIKDQIGEDNQECARNISVVVLNLSFPLTNCQI